MKKSFASLTEDARESLLNVVADVVSELHRSNSKLDDGDDGDNDDDDDEGRKTKGQSGDFIYDFARLNLQYVNQLASLGSNYSALGARALEKIHDYWLGPPKHREDGELTVTGKIPTHCTLRLENPYAKRAQVKVGQAKLKTKSLSKGEKPPQISATPNSSFVDAGKTISFKVTATASSARVGKTYDFELPVVFTSGTHTSSETLKLKVRRVRS